MHKYRHEHVDVLIKVESRNATYGASEGTDVERSIQPGTIPPIPSFLKGILNRRVVKESHRDAPYKGIPPTLLFFPLFFLIFFFFFSFLLSPLTVHRFDHHRESFLRSILSSLL